ncbi:tyrosine-type recombinase/integrase [Microbacterium sp. SYP-A9085]|uniref:tyrosine-type recombinase/integrase n=1 Tax=Microbacterium sp. SYP-A9085 TaxID=2664454 RepID=UPI00129C02B4|nr:tyrosine-type recombinase/integrase [Microbacterium sp. SYP-A9085]MRH29928.1 tyrosine-type recombinase/integrase [Microbacterium sp. SYP-A9085]
MDPHALAEIVAAMPGHYALAVRVMFGGHLRLGELLALQRADFDAATGALRIERQEIVVQGETLVTDTKTGGARTVTLPPSVAVALAQHLAETKGFGRGPMFSQTDGAALTRHGTQQAWRKAARSTGHERYHLHDVRHAGLTLAAQSGATTRELMARAGHRTARAAMIYQHAAEERNALIAAAMDGLSGGALGGTSGTRVARPTPPAVERGNA